MKLKNNYFFDIIINNLFFVLLQLFYFGLAYSGVFGSLIRGSGMYAGLDTLLLVQGVIIIMFFSFVSYRLIKSEIDGLSKKMIYLYLSYALLILASFLVLYGLKTPVYSLVFFLLPLANYGLYKIMNKKDKNDN